MSSRCAGAQPVAAFAQTYYPERIIVDAGGTPIRVNPGEIVALFGAMRSTGDDADRAAHSALAIVDRYGGRAGLDTTRILLRPNDNELVGADSAAAAIALAHQAPDGEIWASKATARQLAARFSIEMHGDARRVTGTRQPIEEVAIGSLRASELAAITGHLERAFSFAFLLDCAPSEQQLFHPAGHFGGMRGASRGAFRREKVGGLFERGIDRQMDGRRGQLGQRKGLDRG